MKPPSVQTQFILRSIPPIVGAGLLSCCGTVAAFLFVGGNPLTAVFISFGALIASLGATVAVAFRLSRGLAAPIVTIARAARALASLDFTARAGYADRGDEFAELGRSVDSLGEKLHTSTEKLEDIVSRRTEDLTKAYNELQKQSEAVRKELMMAQRVQLKMIPRAEDLPNRPELAVASFYAAMENVGGDLYDVIRIGRNAYGFLIADVSGHGVPAALITAMAKVAFRNKARWGVATSDVMQEVNDELLKVMSDMDHYVTAYYGVVNLETGVFQYTNAGHHPAMLLRDGAAEKLDTDGGFLGIFDEVIYESKEVTLRPGDRLLMFTDGIIESRNYLKEQYEYDRLDAYIARHADTPAQDFVDGLVRDIDSFTMGAPQHDDQALVYVEFRGLVQSAGDDVTEPHTTAVNAASAESGNRSANRPHEYAELYRASLKALGDRAYETARGGFLDLLELDPDDPSVLNNLGIAEYRLGRPDQALIAFRKAAERDGDDPRIKRNLERFARMAAQEATPRSPT